MSATSTAWSCPTPASPGDTIVMGHGGGGRMSAELLSSVFLPAFANDILLDLEDQAKVPIAEGTLAMTTDAFVVRPLFFPGGDIGRLAVCGTVNDLVVGGARPLYLTAAFVIEEGLTIAELRRVATSMSAACAEAGVMLVAGDTKVVDRGKGDKLFVTTTGVGIIPPGRPPLSVANARPGDAVIVSGTIGDHGMAIMSVREGLELESDLTSDVAPLGGLVDTILASSGAVRCMRDPTRGGVSSTLHEIAERSKVTIRIDEASIPIRVDVRAACDLLGLDPLYVANEGKLVAIVAEADAERVLAAMREHPLGRAAAIIGRVEEGEPRVVQRTIVGGERIVTLLSGEQLPRIC